MKPHSFAYTPPGPQEVAYSKARQEELDKLAQKGLAQNEKEATYSFRKLRAQLVREMWQHVHQNVYERHTYLQCNYHNMWTVLEKDGVTRLRNTHNREGAPLEEMVQDIRLRDYWYCIMGVKST